MDSGFFAANRTRLSEALEDGVVLLSAHDKMQLVHDMAAPFVQESNFWWLTGLELPGWQLLLDVATGAAALVEPRLGATEKTFESYCTPQEASRISGVTMVLSEDEASEWITGKIVYTLRPHSQKTLQCTPNPAPRRTWRQAQQNAQEVRDIRLVIAKLRAIKQPQEIMAIQAAINITADAFERIAPLVPKKKTEAEIAAEFTYDFMKRGALHAYEPIVAAGANACTLHYINNSSALDGLVLIDIGAKMNGYSADITRTYAHAPLTDRQRRVHAAVAAAHAAIISLLRPGLAVKNYADAVDDIMKQALMSLGLMKSLQDEMDYRRYFPHAISHGLGVDVHDSLGQTEVFEEGMVLTVEPGIYILDEKIGVRIEDDILISATGYQNLSKHVGVML